MDIAYLGNRPEFFPLVAGWIWEEWRDVIEQPTVSEFEQWMRRGGRRRGLPTTLLWMEQGMPIGTVSLELDELGISPELSPWMASLYVLPAHRGRGLGRALVRLALEEARAFGVEMLHLYTPHHQDYYRALGWEYVEECRLRGQIVTLMRRPPPP